jgi:hypothetical protein
VEPFERGRPRLDRQRQQLDGVGRDPLGRAGSPALYTRAKIGGVRGIFRSDSAGRRWVRVNDDEHQDAWTGNAITGDPRVYGRVYVSTNGRGLSTASPRRARITSTTRTAIATIGTGTIATIADASVGPRRLRQRTTSLVPERVGRSCNR